MSPGQDAITRLARRRALQTGLSYIPSTGKIASVHLEYAQNTISGPAATGTDPHPGDEFGIGLRVSLQLYLRH